MLGNSSRQGLDQLATCGLEATTSQIRQTLGVGLPVNQSIKDGSPAHPEDVADHELELDIGVFEDLLDPMGVLGDFSGQLLPSS